MNHEFQDLCRQAGFIQNEIDQHFDGNTVFGTTHDSALRNLIELVITKCANAADQAHDVRCAFPGDYIVEHFNLGLEEGAAAWRSKQ